MKESNISKLIEIEASKYGCITLRLNSGKFYQGTLKNNILTNLRHIKGCPEGTSDLLIIAPNGKTIYCETKTATGKQRDPQIRFQNAIEKLGHIYIIARSIEDVAKALTDV